MRFGMVDCMGPEISIAIHVVGFKDWSTGRGNLGGECGRPIVTNGEFEELRPLPRSP